MNYPLLASRGHLAAGRAIYYGDPQYPDQIVKEYPDGRRQLVEIDEQSVVTVIEEIGPKCPRVG